MKDETRHIQRSRLNHRLGSRMLAMAAMTLVIAVALSACGSSSSRSSSSSSGASSTTGQAAKVTAASAAIAPYQRPPTVFPVTKPLGKRVPAGTRFVYLECSTPICVLGGQAAAQAVKTIGGKMSILNAGSTAATAQAAASSALSLKPAAVILFGVDASTYGMSLKRLQAAGVKVVSVSQAVSNTRQYGIDFNYAGLPVTDLAARLMANWVLVHKGPKANVVFYDVPEIPFSASQRQAFEQELATNCPSCKVRAVPISIATIGSTAPQTVANDLQSHPSTNTAVFGIMEAATGLPAALKAAGLSVTTLGYVPSPQNLQDIKSGSLTAGLAVDTVLTQWVGVDAAARLVLHEPVTLEERAGGPPQQFLEQKDITFDPSHGFIAFPDFASRFAKLWHMAP